MDERKPLRMIPIGIIIGVVAMLPGISGAVMAVLFGIYERLIRDLAELRRYIREDFWFLVLFLVGGVVGTVLSAKLLNIAIEKYPGECLLFFVGLIAGQVPTLYRLTETGEKPSSNNMLAFAAGILVMGIIIVLDILHVSGGEVVLAHDTYGFAVMFLVGLIVALSSLVPGISHATILIVLGLLSAFTAAVGDLDLFLLLPLVLGVIAGALLFSKVVHYALDSYHRSMMFLILGLTIGSLAAVLVSSAGKIDGTFHLAASIAMLAAGLFISILSAKMGGKHNFKYKDTY